MAKEIDIESELAKFFRASQKELEELIIKPGEFSIQTFQKESGLKYTAADTYLSNMVKAGKLTRRPGINENGRHGWLYRPV